MNFLKTMNRMLLLPGRKAAPVRAFKFTFVAYIDHPIQSWRPQTSSGKRLPAVLSFQQRELEMRWHDYDVGCRMSLQEFATDNRRTHHTNASSEVARPAHESQP
jgi:hypothetical protein